MEQLILNGFYSMNFDKKINCCAKWTISTILQNLQTNHKDKNKLYTHHFNISNYSNTSWLAGNTKLNKLFCWPCTLLLDIFI